MVALQGDYGKPRPALVLQSDNFSELPSVIICPATTAAIEEATLFRLTVEPTAENGLRHRSQLAVDKLSVIPRAKVGQVIGRADDHLMQRVSTAISAFLDLN